ncbi:hypothetical protein MGG_07775 [Pyricularia oryzae 70-15]|uniref:Uncharacterized protein n=3 Tax=Pyricularia oryzae TaxID=318829 RepID=G4N108_PYRO7|nr:uncharacterized protein MGG_07775 [Pyricularia oryzae 70-15]EHA53184.1 hypothetical protein MGG_07775 [Pyricularia oryzae 70-15]ELQ44995.1 hypothetical protein OOU_Y34scaffold00030g3 [Pyricularia oryzae Y34]KAI7911408.1 hypothetical protein M9X92_010536 [Pyricularia oryzae]KAI7912279.1 hypothetical protein M0657_010520 [Pyricularia oryzae]
MKTSIATTTLPLLAAGANLQPRQTGQATTACPSLWSAVVTAGPPSPTAVLAWRSSLSARATEACMRFGDPDMPDSAMTALASYQDAFSDYLSKDPTASSAYRLCSVWLNEPISLTDASQIASSESRRSVYESCRENGKLSSWWTSSPATASATATQTQTSGTASAAATGGSTTNAGQTAATSAPAGGAAARGTPVATVSVVVAVAFGSVMGWM